MSEICCQWLEEGETRECEYYGSWACKHPKRKGPVLTSTLLGAHPANCPKLPGMSQEEDYVDDDPRKYGAFRYGGLFHDYEATARDFGAEECFSCKRKFGEKEKPYCRVYASEEGRRFRLICRECAYGFGEGVIEKDGKVYQRQEDFEEGD